jgi:hypothetical protein
MITASEVGEYVFCAKAWKLKLDGIRPESPRLDAGTAYHKAHQSGIHWAQRLRQVGTAVAWIALAAAVIWLVIQIWE